MADISLDTLGLPEDSFGVQTQFDVQDKQNAVYEQNKKIATANNEDKFRSFVAEAKNNNKIAKFGSWVKTELNISNNTTPDDNWQPDDESTLYAMQVHGVPIEHFEDIRNSKSYDEQQIRLDNAATEAVIDEKIANTLNKTERMGAAITGSVADIDMIGGVGVGMIYGASASVMKVAAIEGTLEAGLAAANYISDDRMSGTDALLDVLIGTTLAVGASRLVARNIEGVKSNDNAVISDIVHNETKAMEAETVQESILRQIAEGKQKNKAVLDEQIRIDKVREDIMSQIKSSSPDDINKPSFMEGMKNKQRELQKKIDELDEFNGQPKVTGKDRVEADKIANNRAREASLRQEEIQKLEDDFNTEFNELVRKEDIRLRNEAEVEAMIKRFETDPKYSKESTDAVFRNAEKNRASQVKNTKKAKEASEKIVKIKETVKQIESKLESLNNKIKNGSTKSHETRWKKERDKLIAELKQEKNKLSNDVNARLNNKSKAELGRLNKLINEMAETTEEAAKIFIEDMKLMSIDEVKELKVSIDKIAKMHPKEFKEVQDFMNSILHKKPTYNISKLSKKQRAILGGLGLFIGTAGFASDDNNADEIMYGFIALVVAGTFSRQIIDGIKNKGFQRMTRSVSNGLSNAVKKTDIEGTRQFKTFKEAQKDSVDYLHTRFTSTIAPFQKYSKDSAEFMEKILYSFKKGGGAETYKSMWNHIDIDEYNTAEKIAYQAWRAENGMPKTLLLDVKSKLMFRRELRKAMKNRDNLSDSMQDMVNANDKIMERIYDRAREYKVYGFENIKYTKGKVARLWNGEKMHKLLNNITPTDIIKIRDSIANAILKRGKVTEDVAKKQADSFIDGWKRGGETSVNTRTNDIYASLVDGQVLKDDMTLDDFANAMNVSKNKSARAKARIDFDEDDIADVSVIYKGQETSIGVDFMVETDFKNILDKTANEINVSSSFGKQGYSSIEAVHKHIDDIYSGDPRLKKEARQVVDIISGKPIEVEHQGVHDLILITKDLTAVAKLPLVVFSMPPELMYTLYNSGFVGALKYGLAAFRGKNDKFMSQLMHMSGLGTGTNRIDLTGFQGLSDGVDALQDSDIANSIRSGTMRMRDFSMLANGLAPLSDMFQRMNLMANAESLQEIVKGTKKLSNERMTMFGLDEDTLDMFRKDDWDMDTWGMKKKDKFGEVMRNMNQQYTPETTLGETALFSRTSNAGRLFSSLITYPMQQFNVHGLGDITSMDKTAIMHTTLSFAGAYMGLHARYAIQGKEVDNEKIVQLALLNIPLTGIASQARSMLSPPALQTAQQAGTIIGLD